MPTACSERHIIVVGHNNLFNELLCKFIVEDIGFECTTAINLNDIVALTDNTTLKRLILYDYNNKSSLDHISSYEKDIFKAEYVVLINVPIELQIEQLALQYGVRGFLYYHNGIETLRRMIHSVLNSEIWVSRELITKLLLDGTLRKPLTQYKEVLGSLTAQELKVLNALAQGHANNVIAETFNISAHTVKTHIYRIFKKIKVTNRLQAALWAENHL